MRIAINACGGKRMGDRLGLLQAMASERPAHSFVVFCDKALQLPGIQTELIGSPVTSFLGRRWWLDVKLPAALKQFKPDVLINVTGDASLRTRVPQILFVGDLGFLEFPKLYTSKELLFLKFYLPRYHKKVRLVVTPSEFLKQQLVENFNIDANKISVVQDQVNPSFQPLDWQERQQVKDGWADGREYFLFNGGFDALNDLITVLKAFSQFKRWQKSNMKLLVTGDTSDSSVAEKLTSYKFRDDVVVVEDKGAMNVQLKIMAGAYGLIHTPLYDANALDVMAAMRSGTPVIASNAGAIPALAGEAALFADAGNEDMIAAQMIQLHKDEGLRGRLIEKGKAQAEKYAANDSRVLLWRLINEAV